MSGPGWLTGLLTAVMLTVAVYNVTRLVAAPRWGRAAELDADGTHVVMGVAMAGMLTPGLSFAPRPLWLTVFAAGGAWFGWQFLRTRSGQAAGRRRCPHPLPHLIECAAMVFMFALPATVAAATAGGGMGTALTGAAAGFSPLTLLLAVFMVGYVMWLGNNLSALTTAPAGGTTGTTTTGTATTGTVTTGYLAPRCAACCKIAMGVTMGYMLIMLL
ncbi:MAG TPA: DUF5134 domain-containing protein [Streptosporangiaceae bacterium]